MLIKCTTCQKDVSANAKVCPHCGVDYPVLAGQNRLGFQQLQREVKLAEEKRKKWTFFGVEF